MPTKDDIGLMLRDKLSKNQDKMAKLKSILSSYSYNDNVLAEAKSEFVRLHDETVRFQDAYDKHWNENGAEQYDLLHK